MDLIKITPNKEKARNILKIISLIEERLEGQDRIKMASLIIADYYEIMKELITAILLTDGYKTLSHKDLIDYLREKYSEFTAHQIFLMHNLRILRNRISYEGFSVEPSYLKRNEIFYKQLVHKLKTLVIKKIDKN